MSSHSHSHHTQLQADFNMTAMNKYFMILLLCFLCDVVPIHSQQGIDKVLVVGCSLLHYAPNSTYEYNLNSLFTSLRKSATNSSYNNFTVQASSPADTITGLYQCRADLSLPDCATCISHALTQIPTSCPSTSGASLYLEACFVKYDNSTFLGLEDKTVVLNNKCGTPIDVDVEAMTQWDSMLEALLECSGAYRVGEAGKFRGVAQCVGDLSASQCQDCVAEAVSQLKAVCGAADFGDMFLDKCYARYSTQMLPPPIQPQHEHEYEHEHEHEHEYGRARDECCGDIKIIEIGVGVAIVGVGIVVTFVVMKKKTCKQQTGCKKEAPLPARTQTGGYIPYKVDIELKTPIPQKDCQFPCMDHHH